MLELNGKSYNILTIDFETYWDSEFSLSKMSTTAYVRDKRFIAHMCGIKLNKGPTTVFHGFDAIKAAFAGVDWKNTFVLAHNCAFDGFILTQIFKQVPAGYLDTLSMARGVFGHSVRHGLKYVGPSLGLGGKEDEESLEDSLGMTTLPPILAGRMTVYCARDVELCRDIFDRLYHSFPDDELKLVDLTLRMFCEPAFLIDRTLVQEEYEAEVATKARHIIITGQGRETFTSNAKFAAFLDSMGVPTPLKISPATGMVVPAFAKTDEGMRELANHSNPDVAAAAAARLGLKSTIGETRALRFLDVADHGKTLPVFLNYYGAHTGRWSGGDKINLQNLPRTAYLADGSVDPNTGRLRRALLAPKGKMIVVADSGQIEARVNAWLAGQTDMLDIFRAYDAGTGPDAYRVMASKLFGVPIDQVTKQQRFIGKVCVLALGYGMGHAKLRETLANAGVSADAMQTQAWTDTYRNTNNMIVRLWRELHLLTPRLSMETCNVPFGPVTLLHEAVKLPSGLYLRYNDLEVDAEGSSTYAGRRGARNKLYGGLFCENLVQALSRCIIAEQMITLADEGHRILTTTHDEIVVLSSAAKAEKTYQRMIEVMSTPPEWAPDLPLAADGGWAENYSK